MHEIGTNTKRNSPKEMCAGTTQGNTFVGFQVSHRHHVTSTDQMNHAYVFHVKEKTEEKINGHFFVFDKWVQKLFSFINLSSSFSS